jgi:hypothetical protein
VASKQQATLSVAVRVRPLLKAEGSPKKDIVRVIDKKIVVVLDPDETKVCGFVRAVESERLGAGVVMTWRPRLE